MDYKIKDGLGYFIIVVAGKIKNKFYQLLSSYDITPEQWIILTRLYESDGKSQKQLGMETYKDEPNIARILKKMQDKGYIERGTNEKDKRSTLVYITQKGIRLYEELIPIVSHHQKETIKKLSADEVSTLIDLLGKL